MDNLPDCNLRLKVFVLIGPGLVVSPFNPVTPLLQLSCLPAGKLLLLFFLQVWVERLVWIPRLLSWDWLTMLVVEDGFILQWMTPIISSNKMRFVTLYFTELHCSTSIHYFHKQHICRFKYSKLFTLNNFILNITSFFPFVKYVHKRSNHAEPTQASLQFSLQDCFCNPLEPLCSKYDCCINNTCVKFAACW